MRTLLFAVSLFGTANSRKLQTKCSSLPSQVCTPEGVSVECAHSACTDFIPGSCFEITQLSQSLVPNMRACYGERYPELMDATLLWNERSMRGIPAIAAAEGAGTLESMHMQMDIALMFDHWDIIDRKIQQILDVRPDDPHALFAKVMYGFEGVLPSVKSPDVETAMVHLERVAPKTAGLVDRALADVKMVWFYEFIHPLTPSAETKEVCEIGMFGEVTGELFPTFSCEIIPELYDPRNLAILTFGASGGNPLEARIATTRQLATMYPEATILATGGALETDLAEGDLIKAALPEFADRIVVDRGARDTIGNSLAIADFLQQNKIDNLLIVTSTYHLPRATMALRGVLQRNELYPKTYMVGAGNHVQASLGTWSEENQDWLETAYGGEGRFRAIEIPMTNRDFARGAGLFTFCDFEELEA